MSTSSCLASVIPTNLADLTARLGDGVDPPPEMAALKEARDSDSDENTLALRIYELMIGE